MYILSIGAKSFLTSRWDRYLGMTAAMTQVPVPTARMKNIYGIYNQMQIQQLECITSLIHTKINIIPL